MMLDPRETHYASVSIKRLAHLAKKHKTVFWFLISFKISVSYLNLHIYLFVFFKLFTYLTFLDTNVKFSSYLH